MNSFKIGLTSTTFKKKSIREVVEAAKKAGVSYIEWGERCHINTLEDAREAKLLCDEAGIEISSFGSYYAVGSGDETEHKRLCELTKAMGADSIRIWLGKKNSEETDGAEYKTLLEDAKKLCDTATEYGIFICAECHDHTFNNNTDAILKFTAELGRENFRTYYQSRYFRFEYDLDRIDRTYAITKDVHVSYSEVTREQRFRKKNRKYLDTILKKFREKNFDGIVMLEFTKRAKVRNLIRDVEKLRKY